MTTPQNPIPSFPDAANPSSNATQPNEAPAQNVQQVVNVTIAGTPAPTQEIAVSGPEKSFNTYLMCAVFGGCVGAHHYYTNNIGKGILYTLTFGLFTLGWIKDILSARRDFNREMASQGILSARVRS